jgi:tRNA-binding EMAP/Myf-like protein
LSERPVAMKEISWDEFAVVELRVGTIVEV